MGRGVMTTMYEIPCIVFMRIYVPVKLSQNGRRWERIREKKARETRERKEGERKGGGGSGMKRNGNERWPDSGLRKSADR